MAIRKIRLGGEQLGRVQKKHVERAFDEKSIPEPKIDNVEIPPIQVNSEDRYKYVNHRLGRKPDVQLIDESGEIRYVQVIHLSDDSLQLNWVGSIVGNIIIE